jgi:phytoene synthase
VTPADPGTGKAAPPGSPAWYALLFTPEASRDAVGALFELRAEIMDSARTPAEPAVAQARLDWWRAEIAGYGAGHAQHPALRRVQAAGLAGVVQPEYLLEMVDAFASELDEAPCSTYAELTLYCYRSGGVLHEMVAGALGLADARNERGVVRYAQRLGTGARLVELLANLRGDLAAGRHLLPRDWIAETGAAERFEGQQIDPVLAACVDRLAGEARAALDDAESLLPRAERPRQRTGLVLAALYRRHLDRLHRSGFDPGALPGNLDNLWTCWRAARKARAPG